MKCPNCYSPIPNGVQICPRCSYNVMDSEQESDGVFRFDQATEEASPWGNQPHGQTSWDSNQELNQSSAQPTHGQFNWHTNNQVVAAPQARGVERLQLLPEQLTTLKFAAFGRIAFVLLIMGGVGLFFLPNFYGLGSMNDGFFPLMMVIIMGIFIFTGFTTIRLSILMFQDAGEGIALRRVDYVEKKRRTRRKNGYDYYGHFRDIGKIKLKRAHFDSIVEHRDHVIVHSPRSNYIWDINVL